MKNNLKTLKHINVFGKRVFVRADLNVINKKTNEISEQRLRAIVPTLRYLQQAGVSKIILASHIGSPKVGVVDDNLSTKRLILWLEQQGFAVDFQSDLKEAQKQSIQNNGRLLLLENLRFFPGEKNKDLAFAQQLASLADVYVNDAFGALHRDDASLVLLAQQFSSDSRCIGLLVEKEIHMLDGLKNNPQQPFVIVLGGSKLEDKIALLECFLAAPPNKFSFLKRSILRYTTPLVLSVLRSKMYRRMRGGTQDERFWSLKYEVQEKNNCPQTIIIGGAVALVFARAQGFSAGALECSEVAVAHAKKFIALAAEHSVQLVLPSDMLFQHNEKLVPCAFNNIPADATCGDIGPATCKQFVQELAKAKTIFVNGTMGICEQAAFHAGTKSVLQAAAQSNGTTIIGGGDTGAAVDTLGLHDKFTFVSTGGGATLAFLGACDPMQELAALHVLCEG